MLRTSDRQTCLAAAAAAAAAEALSTCVVIMADVSALRSAVHLHGCHRTDVAYVCTCCYLPAVVGTPGEVYTSTPRVLLPCLSM